jgi:hypothetical protein
MGGFRAEEGHGPTQVLTESPRLQQEGWKSPGATQVRMTVALNLSSWGRCGEK